MSTIVTVARLLLAAIFVLAALGKLLDRAGTRRALVEFDVPPRAARAGALLLPMFELMTALALVFQPTARAGAAAAAVLFAAFTIGIARVVRAGRSPDCHCFGQLHSAPASGRTLARNGVLLALALFASLAGPGRAVDALVTTRVAGTASLAVGLVLLILATWLWANNRRLRTAAAATEHLPVGAPAPAFAAQAAGGELVTLSDICDGRPLMLLFTSALCTQCRMFMPELARWQARLADVLSIVPVAHGDRHVSHAHALEHAVEGMLFTDDDRALIDAYAVPVTPCAILVGPDGSIASAPIEGADAIDALLAVIAYDRSSVLSVQSAATA